MITREDCVPNQLVIVNNKVTKFNTLMGTTVNGMVAFPFKPEGVLMGEEIEIKPDTRITILSKPKEFNGNGNQVKFKLDGDDTIFSAWWICFKHKVDKI